MVIKVMARGMFVSKFTYLRDPWNWLDMIVIASGIPSIALRADVIHSTTTNASATQALRTFRVLRAVKTISIFPGLRTIVNAMLRAIKMLTEVVLLTMFCLLVFSLISVQIYRGTLRQKCVKDPFQLTHLQHTNEPFHQFYNRMLRDPNNWHDGNNYNLCGNTTGSGRCQLNFTCQGNVGENPNFGFMNFDNVYWSALITFQLMTIDFWENAYRKVLLTNGYLAVIFFILTVFFGSFYLLNLMLAVVTITYQEEAERTHKELESEKAAKRQRKQAASGIHNVTKLATQQNVWAKLIRENKRREKNTKEFKLQKLVRTRTAISAWQKLAYKTHVDRTYAKHFQQYATKGSSLTFLQGEESSAKTKPEIQGRRFSKKQTPRKADDDGGNADEQSHLVNTVSANNPNNHLKPPNPCKQGFSRGMLSSSVTLDSVIALVLAYIHATMGRGPPFSKAFSEMGISQSVTQGCSFGTYGPRSEFIRLCWFQDDRLILGQSQVLCEIHASGMLDRCSQLGCINCGFGRSHGKTTCGGDLVLGGPQVLCEYLKEASTSMTEEQLKSMTSVVNKWKFAVSETKKQRNGEMENRKNKTQVTSEGRSCSTGIGFIGSRMQNTIHCVVSDIFFELFIDFCIVLNTTLMSVEYHGMTQQMEDAIHTSGTVRGLTHLQVKGVRSVTGVRAFQPPFHRTSGTFKRVFTLIFDLEAVLKIIGFGIKGYFGRRWNRFDFTISLISSISLVLQLFMTTNTKWLQFLTAFRLLRILKLAQVWPAMNTLLTIIGNALSALGQLTIILGIILYIFAIIGLQLFHDKYDKFQFPNGIPRWNFTDFFHSFMMMFRVLCGEWMEPLMDCMRMKEVGNSLCMLVFFPTLIFGNFVVLNLFLALLLNSFGENTKNTADTEEARRLREAKYRFKAKFNWLIRIFCPEKEILLIIHRKDRGSNLTSRVNTTDSNLTSRVDTTDSNLTSRVDTPDRSLTSRVNTTDSNLTSRVDTPDRSLTSRVNTTDSNLTSRVDTPDRSLTSRVNTTDSNLTSRVDTTDSNLTSRVDTPDRSLTSRVNTTDSNLTSRVNTTDSNLTSKLSSISSKETFTAVTGNAPTICVSFKETMTREGPKVSDAIKVTPVAAAPHTDMSGSTNESTPPPCLPKFIRKKMLSLCNRFNNSTWGKKWTALRQAMLKRVVNDFFEYAVMFVIILSSVMLAFEDFNYQQTKHSVLRDIIRYANYTFAVVFTLEMIIRWMANGMTQYFTSAWNIIDFIVVVVSVLAVVTADDAEKSGGNLSDLSAFRALRAFRPLRVVSRIEGMKIVVNSLMRAIPAILNVFVVSLLFWLIFCVMGVQFFRGRFYKCINLQSQDKVPNVGTRPECEKNPKEWYWYNSNINFDNAANGFLALFQVATFEGWMEIMHDAVDSTDVDLQPRFEASVYTYLYFVAFIICGSFFSLNLVIGVIIDNFNVLKKKYEGSYLDGFLTPTQRNYFNTLKKMSTRKPQRMIPPPRRRFQIMFYNLAVSDRFELVLMSVVMLNMVVLGVEYSRYKLPCAWYEVLWVLDVGFCVFFVIEAIMKLVGLRQYYFTLPWNCFDFTVAVLTTFDPRLLRLFEESFRYFHKGKAPGAEKDTLPLRRKVDRDGTHHRAGRLIQLLTLVIKEKHAEYALSDGGIFVLSPTFLRLLRIFRISRVLRIIKVAKGLRKVIFSLVISLPAIINIMALLLLCLYIYAIFGMFLFSNIKISGALTPMMNFRSFKGSALLLLSLSTAAGWNDVLEPLLLQPPFCNDTHFRYDDGHVKKISGGDCGNHYMAVPYMVSYIILTSLFIINLYIAVILENYNQAHQQDEVGVTEDDFDMFYRVWQRYDPNATQYLPYSQLSNFVADLDPPLGIQKPNEIALVSLNLPILQGDKVHCLDILLALVRNVLPDIDESGEMQTIKAQIHTRFMARFPSRVKMKQISSTIDRKKQDVAARTLQRAWRSFKEGKMWFDEDHVPSMDYKGKRPLKVFNLDLVTLTTRWMAGTAVDPTENTSATELKLSRRLSSIVGRNTSLVKEVTQNMALHTPHANYFEKLLQFSARHLQEAVKDNLTDLVQLAAPQAVRTGTEISSC
ncbi:sodium channel protein 1 brain-like [Babylonia areolata]|uniref:sodium channel protein 1 brain-like n=1 Tax=Babylonia areolata TaxID=304850 RepID=UPI003FD65088